MGARWGDNIQEGRGEEAFRREQLRQEPIGLALTKAALTIGFLAAAGYGIVALTSNKADDLEGDYVAMECDNQGMVSEWANGDGLDLTIAANPNIDVNSEPRERMVGYFAVPQSSEGESFDGIGMSFGGLEYAMDTGDVEGLRALAIPLSEERELVICQDIGAALDADPAQFREDYGFELEAMRDAYREMQEAA